MQQSAILYISEQFAVTVTLTSRLTEKYFLRYTHLKSLDRNGLITRINCLYYMKSLDGIVESFKDETSKKLLYQLVCGVLPSIPTNLQSILSLLVKS